MHTLINKRPFFSIIIPCYNSKNTIDKLLNSIVKQDLPYEDIQVIISDDCSTESYEDILNNYTDKLFITKTKTKYNCCPGNTRQAGVEKALGEWICFADHDDQLIPESYKAIKKEIQLNKIDTVLISKFYKKQDQYYIEMPQNAGWTHGKFFNLDNFWNKYNLHYIKDMKSHQDICISSQMEFIRTAYNIPIYFSNLATYIWVYNPNSLSNCKYVEESKERVFIDKFLIDYIESTAGISYNFYKKFSCNKNFTMKQIERVILYSYFYNEYGRFITPSYLIKNCNHIKHYLDILNNQFNCSIDDIYNFFRKDNPEQYKTVYNIAKDQIQQFCFEFSFKEWLDWIYNKKYLKA